jgi:hypothetical protein
MHIMKRAQGTPKGLFQMHDFMFQGFRVSYSPYLVSKLFVIVLFWFDYGLPLLCHGSYI